jgi:hypothetical protein
MKKHSSYLLNWFVWILVILGVGWLTWKIGFSFNWSWGDFWSDFISNAGSSAVIGFIIYWIITRPDEKRARQERKNQALAILKIEFEVNLERARLYGGALKRPSSNFSSLYPLRFTRGAWNALKESGFLAQLEDVEFVYELLRANEVITVTNNSLLKVRNAKADKEKAKLNIYAKKAVKECSQIEILLQPILEKLVNMKLPEVKLPQVSDTGEDDEGE